ncbi:uncharacterized protein LOC114244864 isoform X1 [Bombyx mandarina]|uniref:Uncharacterized protein LOC114244864 isoform X1 n=1 Tax=Bombyx mandarina TaxID=7092 RepID=A0A6J2JWQ1_BOMMA|nr:uncharacterized protein LOC114244864 isoform X1 [Bombyx mandarina]
MRNILMVCAICMVLAVGNALPNNRGVGAFAYQDSSGNRYGGTYGLKDGAVVDKQGDFPPNFQPESFQDLDYFFPEYFRNFENLLREPFFRFTPIRTKSFFPYTPLRFEPFRPFPSYPQRAFSSNIEAQRLAFEAAQKAFDLTSNQAGYIPGFDRFPIFNFPSPGFTDEQFPAMQNYPNQFGAFAGAAAGPGFSHQVASINPPNPNMPNVNKYTSYSGAQPNDGNQFVSVSSSSYSSSVNDNGEVKNHRAAETVVNNNGKVTKYKVEN